jgi:poly-gamma-glutamate synthesis protein (capsule biosynthesis protein)
VTHASLLLTAALAAAPTPTADLWLGGDVHLGSSGAGVLDPLAPALRGAAGMVNFEGAISESPTAAGDGGPLRLFSHPRSAGQLAAAGVAVVSLANNHALDAGPRGLARSRQVLGAAGILAVEGAHAVLERGGLRIAVLAVDASGGAVPDFAARLSRARQSADALVVSIHVGGAALWLPTPATRALVDEAVGSGATVVAVHGTHALGPVERRGAAVVLWGLGNLAFDCRCTDEAQSMVVRVTLTRGGAREARVIPIRAGLHGKPAAEACGAA